jgi:hypothetical protein
VGCFCSPPGSTCSSTSPPTSASWPSGPSAASTSTRASTSSIASSGACITSTRTNCESPGIAAIAWGALELIEGVGLWLDQLWAEYLTLIATLLLIPFELYELAIRPSLFKAGGLLVNVLIVLYLALALRRRLAVARPEDAPEGGAGSRRRPVNTARDQTEDP